MSLLVTGKFKSRTYKMQTQVVIPTILTLGNPALTA